MMQLGIKYERAQRTADPACFRGGITINGPIEPMPMPSLWDRFLAKYRKER